MPELRQAKATRGWIVIATERARRPHDFRVKRSRADLTSSEELCPFCQGNETMTPPEVMAYRHGDQANGPGWWVRVAPNKYPALISEGSLKRKAEEGFFRKMDGVGRHEIVIESPRHDLCIPTPIPKLSPPRLPPSMSVTSSTKRTATMTNTGGASTATCCMKSCGMASGSLMKMTRSSCTTPLPLDPRSKRGLSPRLMRLVLP